MKHAATLVDLFTAALKLGVDVVIYEHRLIGARGALFGWAAVVNAPVRERELGRLNRGYYVELANGAEIQVVVRNRLGMEALPS